VDRIGKSITGEVQLDLTHFPVDAARASVVAQEVNAATGSGLLLPTGLSGITCDVNSSADTSVPAETFTEGTFPDYGSNLEGFNEFGLGDPPVDNPEDDLGGQSTPSGAQLTLTSDGDIDTPVVGDTLTAPTICAGGEIVFYRLDPTVEGGRVIVAQATSTYTMVINDVDKSVYAEIRCPDPSTPTGYGEPIPSAPTKPVDEWRRFTQTGEFAAYRTVNQTITALYDCSGVLIQNATSQVDGPFFYAARNNVVGYRLGDNTSVITYVCPPTAVDTNTVSMGISVLYSNNTSEFIGTTLPNGNRTPNQTGTRTEVWTFSITVGGTPIYP
jgi:hypothetical protein